MNRDEFYMRMALDEARRAAERGEVPVGAVVADKDGLVLAAAGNRSIELNDPSAHAEMIALRAACRGAGNYRLPGAMIYVTLEPCVMCAGAMVQARIGRLVFGAADPKAGAVVTLYRVGCDGRLNHVFAVEEGLMKAESAELLRNFFKIKRGTGL